MQSHVKSSFSTIMLMLLMSFSLSANSLITTDSTGLPGDHFSLEGALELFKKANSLEAFEKALNTESNHVNNLDLNEDGDIDYIRVIDNMEDDVHAIVLQVPVSKEESQDIAVIEIEKQGDEEAILQIIGDADIYGEEVIAEPFEEESAKGSKGGMSVDMGINRIIVNVWFWPSVRFVYAPGYRPWRSPWYWGYYPKYWRPWRPLSWHRYHVHVKVYRPRYRVVTTHRVVRAHRVYTPRRTHSKVVHTRTTTRVAARKTNTKAVGAKRTKTTTVKSKNGKAATRTTKTTTVQGKNGKKATRTTKTTKVKGKKGTATRKTSTTKAGKRGKNGAVGAKRKTSTTKVRRKKN